MTGRDWTRLLLLAVLWSSSYYFAEIALRGFGPLTIAAGRVTLGAVVLGAWLGSRGRSLPVDRRSLVSFFAMGLLNNAIPFTLIFWAQIEIASGVAAILNTTTPLFSALLAAYLGIERLTVTRMAGLLLGVVGVALVVGGDELIGTVQAIAAEGAVLLAALFYAIAGQFGRRRFAGLDPDIAACGMLVGSSTVLVAPALLIEQPWRSLPSPGAIIAVGALGLFGAAFAYALYFRILAGAGATNLLLVTFLLPVGALALGSTLLGEAVRVPQLGGLALILVALALIDGRWIRRLTAPWRPTEINDSA